MTNEKWLNWAIELQALAQAGLFYGRDVYDIERFQRIRDIAAEMLADRTELPPDTVRGLFCNETGYQTPKIETRAAVFRDGKILLVQEKDGLWALPGGWCDVLESVRSNTEKEVREEAGLDVRARRRTGTGITARATPTGSSSFSSSASCWAGSSARTARRWPPAISA